MSNPVGSAQTPLSHLNRRSAAPHLKHAGAPTGPQERIELSRKDHFQPSSGLGGLGTGKIVGLAGLGLVAVAGGIWGIANTTHVGPNEHAVIYNKSTGEVSNSSEHGWFLPGEYNPFTTEIHTVTAEPQSFKLEDAPIRTRDKASTTLDVVVNYRVTDAGAVVQQFGSVSNLNDKVYSVSRSVARDGAGQFTLDELQIDSDSRSEFEHYVREQVTARMDRFARENFGEGATNPITISTPELRDVVTPHAIAQERDATLVATQKQRTAEANLEAERLEAQSAVIEANAQKEAAKIKAESEREAAIIAAEGQAEAAAIEAEAIRTLDEAYQNVSDQTMRRLELETLENLDGQVVIGVDGIEVVTPSE